MISCLLWLALGVAAVPAAGADAVTPARTLAANTVVELDMVDAVSSATSQPGDFFRMRVAQDVLLDGQVVIAAGSPALGQVVHAQKARGGGKAGELIVAARHVETPQGRIPLRSGFGAAAKHRYGASFATAVAVGVFGMLVKGKELELPTGQPLSARTAQDILLPAASPPLPHPTPRNE